MILDGVVVTAAAMVAEELTPGAARWWVAGHRSAEPAHTIALRHLRLEPILDLDMRLGRRIGRGGRTARRCRVRWRSSASMATFSEAGVSTRDEAPTKTAG